MFFVQKNYFHLSSLKLCINFVILDLKIFSDILFYILTYRFYKCHMLFLSMNFFSILEMTLGK